MNENGMKFFNDRGICFPERHYMLPPLDRVPSLDTLIAQGSYIVLHAPRMSGKTTAIKACARRINTDPGSPYFAFYLGLGMVGGIEDPEEGMAQIVRMIHHDLHFSSVGAEGRRKRPPAVRRAGEGDAGRGRP
jgi:hypothetical protein